MDQRGDAAPVQEHGLIIRPGPVVADRLPEAPPTRHPRNGTVLADRWIAIDAALATFDPVNVEVRDPGGKEGDSPAPAEDATPYPDLGGSAGSALALAAVLAEVWYAADAKERDDVKRRRVLSPEGRNPKAQGRAAHPGTRSR
jgi:hypothetical protein